jgi:hypothetical protein
VLHGFSRAALAALLCAAPTVAAAQTAGAPADAAPPVAAATPPTALLPSNLKLPALTVVELTVVEEVSSKTAVTGQAVKLALASPLHVTTDLGLPAGTPVEGVVIHSARPGMGGKAGELLIGAKRIALSQSVEIPLRSFKLTPARGKNNEGTAMGLTVAAGAVGGVAAMFITGGSAVAPAGVGALAKTATDATIPIVLLTKLPPQPTTLILPMPASASALPTTTTHATITNQGNPK